MDLKYWLQQQGLPVRDFAVQLEVPLRTVENWVYSGVAPSEENRVRLADYIILNCTHYWNIETPQGPTSEGVCQRCGNRRDFMNSVYDSPFLRLDTKPM